MQDDAPEPSSSGLQLRDLVAIIQMQWRVVAACTVAAVIVALVHGMLATSMYRSTTVLHLAAAAGQEVKADRVVDVDQYNRWNRQMFVQTQLEILRSRRVLDEALRRYDELGFGDLRADGAGFTTLNQMLDVNPRQGTELLDLSITSEDPDKSAILANLISQVYTEKNLATTRELAQGAKLWLQGQIAEYRTRIDESTRAMITFQTVNDLADVQEEITGLGSRMGSLNQAFAEIQTERVLLETEVWSHERMLREGNFQELAKEIDSALVSALTADYANAVSEHAEYARRYGEKYPERMQAEARLQRIQSELQAEIEVSLRAERERLRQLRNKETNLTTELGGGKVQLLDVHGKREQFEKLQMDLQRAKDTYLRLTQRDDELDLQSQTQLNNVTVIDHARPVLRRVEPNVLLNLALALVGGFVGGMILGFAREYLDDTISSPLEVQTFLKVPFLGMIPKIPDVTDETDLGLYTHRNPRSTVAEALRGIRTVVELDPNGPPRRLLVTSAVSSEGKTSTIVRLGVAFANLDKRVLMIDADLRRPRLHKIFGLDKTVGLASVLAGVPAEEAVRSTIVPNLFVMPSGRGGERPNELLASPALQKLFEALEQDYDLLLIDSPPTVLLSDSRILSRYVDGVIIVVREHTTSRVLVREGVSGLEQVGARVLGAIVNNVDLSQRRTSYKYHYGYGYGYGYGYRYDRYYTDLPADDGPDDGPDAKPPPTT